MSDAIKTRKISRSVEAISALIVDYNVGAALTATCGNLVYRAKNRNGNYVFYLPKLTDQYSFSSSWDLTSSLTVNGKDYTASYKVDVRDREVTQTDLYFEDYALQPYKDHSGFTGTWIGATFGTTSSTLTVSVNSTDRKLTATQKYSSNVVRSGWVSMTNELDLSMYDQITVAGSKTSSSSATHAYFCVWKDAIGSSFDDPNLVIKLETLNGYPMQVDLTRYNLDPSKRYRVGFVLTASKSVSASLTITELKFRYKKDLTK